MDIDLINLIAIFITIFIIFFINYKNNFIAKKIALYDFPDKKLKLHSKQVPLIGGIYCFVFINLMTGFFLVYDLDKYSNYIIILLTSNVIFIIGLIDDKINISPNLKLFLSFITIFLSLYFFNDFIIKEIYFETFKYKLNLGMYSLPFSILCILLLINALNMADGINSLASSLVVTWCFSFIIFDITNNKFLILLIGIFMIFISIKIYRSNFFLGDSGAMFLSTFISLILISGYNFNKSNIDFPVEIIFIFLMLPGIDMFRLFIIRIYNKRNPFKGDLYHFHNYLMKKFNLKKSLIIYLSLCILPIIASFFFKNYLIIISLSLIGYIIIILFLYFKTSISKKQLNEKK